MGEVPDMDFEGERTLRLMTTRGDDQFNTTVYGSSDRFRGVFNTREVILMNREDRTRLNIAEDQALTVTTVSNDGVTRSIDGLRAHAFDIPAGCALGYYPECNPLVPLAHHAKRSKVPAAKAIPVRIRGLRC